MTYLGVLAILLLIAAPYLAEAARKRMTSDVRGAAGGHFADLSQGVTHYTWSGGTRGPIAVCVHGLTTPSFVWGGVIRGLEMLGYRTLTYDLYGRGFSDHIPGRQTKEFHLRQLEDLLADQEIGSDFTLIGYSMGGAIATVFAAAHPERVRHLVLIAPAGMGMSLKGIANFVLKAPVVGDWLMLALFPRMHRKSVKSEGQLTSSVPDIGPRTLAELKYRGYIPAVLSSMRGILSTPLKQEHKAIKRAGVPVLAIWGSDDQIIPGSSAGRMTEWNRNVQHEVIDSAGHGLTYTHADQVIGALKASAAEFAG